MGQRMRFEPIISSDIEPLWMEDLPAPLIEVNQGSATCPNSQMSGTMWSTETPLPMLPHLSMPMKPISASTSRLGGDGSLGFEIPKEWSFDPVLQGWVAGMR